MKLFACCPYLAFIYCSVVDSLLRDRIVMRFEPQTGPNAGHCHVVLRKASHATASITELRIAPLFSRRIRIEPCALEIPPSQHRLIDLRGGWYTSDQPSPYHAMIRPSLWIYPEDVFAPVREGRRVSLDNLPYPNELWAGQVMKELYKLSHVLNVLSLSQLVQYVPKSKDLSGWVLHMDFATRAEAEATSRFTGIEIGGRRLHIAGTKYLASTPCLGMLDDRRDTTPVTGAAALLLALDLRKHKKSCSASGYWVRRTGSSELLHINSEKSASQSHDVQSQSIQIVH
ncbi:hypothetical protein CC86DRAFT_181974 [Ophiobolus disseminans]|uniref:Uncharacterized protein n=1 Tax=Ophiobolus disseminans TaxID=1469910 RepID=A0A6A7ABV3_9PLEO|nr:hypothetical protein CC86DRAFT_181974 [Ophiobolus disseminans]